MDTGYGARPSALGKAFVALADDANALYYNPAGMAFIDKMTFLPLIRNYIRAYLNLYMTEH